MNIYLLITQSNTKPFILLLDFCLHKSYHCLLIYQRIPAIKEFLESEYFRNRPISNKMAQWGTKPIPRQWKKMNDLSTDTLRCDHKQEYRSLIYFSLFTNKNGGLFYTCELT